MHLVIADTSPINYLLLIGHIEILPAMFERVILPAVVSKELLHPKVPKVVAGWIASPPDWVEVRESPSGHIDNPPIELNPGGEDAIAPAIDIHADLLLMDDEDGVMVALSKGLKVAGMLGLLSRASQRGLIDPVDAFDRLKRTNFRCRRELLEVPR